MDAKMKARLKREVDKLASKPPPGISCHPHDDSLKVLDATVMGAAGSPYENGIFNIEINIPSGYPFDPPTCRFKTKIYHPNIDEAGRICMDLLRQSGDPGTWRPTSTIESALIAIQFLITNPNPDDPLVVDIANEFISNRLEFNEKAKKWTAQYAIISLKRKLGEAKFENLNNSESKRKKDVGGDI